MIQGANGNFYGMTYNESDFVSGTVFEVTSTGVLTTLFTFDGANGGSPFNVTLVQVSDGSFYGTTNTGGSANSGVVFHLIVPRVETPVLNPSAGTYYTTAQPVTITSATPGATIRYTTDGSMPSETNGIIYLVRLVSAGQPPCRLLPTRADLTTAP